MFKSITQDLAPATFNVAKVTSIRGAEEIKKPTAKKKAEPKEGVFYYKEAISPDKLLHVAGTYNQTLDTSSLLDHLHSVEGVPADWLRQLDTFRGVLGWKDIRAFLSVLEEHVDADIVCVLKNTPTCPECGSSMEEYDSIDTQTYTENDPVSTAGILVCLCGFSQVNNEPVKNYSSSMVGLGGKYMNTALNTNKDNESGERNILYDHNFYDDQENFTRAWDSYHCIPQSKLPEDLFERLDEYFKIHGMHSGEYYRSQPVVTNMYGEEIKEGTSVEALNKALKELKLPYYNDEFYIRHVYWGWPRPDATPFKERVFRNYERTQSVFMALKDERKSSLNSRYRLYQELRAAGHMCHPHTFNIVNTEKTKAWHNEIRKKMCEMVKDDGDVPIEFFPVQ